jgi:cohesin loading factor subunit SCC2
MPVGLTSPLDWFFRILDEDDTVKDLAIKAIEELWFPPMPLQSAIKSRTAAPTNSLQDKTPLLSKVSGIMGTSANFKDRQSPLEDVLHTIMAEKEGNDKNSLHLRYTEICEALIDGLVDASDLPGFVRSWRAGSCDDVLITLF